MQNIENTLYMTEIRRGYLLFPPKKENKFTGCQFEKLGLFWSTKLLYFFLYNFDRWINLRICHYVHFLLKGMFRSINSNS